MLPTDWRARIFFVVLLGWPTHNTALAQSFPTHSIKEAISLYPGATCLESGRLAGAVERVLSTNAIDSRIRVEVRGDWQAPNVVSITIWRVDQAYATRRFDDAPADCVQVHSLVGLAIAFAIDATWLAKPKKEEKLASPPVAEIPAFIPSWALGIDAAMSGGVVLGTGMGADIGLARSVFSWLDLRLSILGVFTLKKQSIPPDTGTFDMILTAARLDACGSLPLQPRLAVRACLGAAVGGLTTVGRDYYFDSMTDTTLWSAGVGGIETLWTLSKSIGLVVAFDGVVPIGRHIIQVVDFQNQRVDYRPLSPVAVMGRLGPLFYFP